MTAQDSASLTDLWAQAVDRVKQTVISPALWRAVERTLPVAWEENYFVIGLSSLDGQMAGTLNTRENLLAIERVLREVTGSGDLRVRLIDGVDLEDWEAAKVRDAAALASRQQVTQKRVTESASFASWDAIYDQISRLWANSEYRALASGRGRYIDNALDLILKAMDSGLYPAEGKVDEPTERGLNRLLDRIGSVTNSDPAVIAYLLYQRRRKP
ncbi:MAG: hypothetical protein H7Z41_01000 [Cytophagales bacterium]|nr:hypothetical protein [Armatimonadota bacterium]